MLQLVLLATLSASYLYFVVVPAPPGPARLLLSLPVLAAYLAAPRVLCYDRSSVSAAGALGFVISWLGGFKVLGLCMNRGPLATSLTLPQFCVLLLLPLKPAQQPQRTHREHLSSAAAKAVAPARLQSLAVKATALGALTFAFTTYALPSLVQSACYAIYVWLLTEVMLEGPAMFAKYCLGLEMAPVFDNPPLATSVSDWWGRRYNLVVSQVLKSVVYEPVLDGRLVNTDSAAKHTEPSSTRQAVALLAVFAVSGLMHELVLWYMCGVWPIRQFVFFALQGPIILLERALLKGRQSWHRQGFWARFARRCATLGLLLLMAEYLFFPVFVDYGLDQKGMREIRGLLEGLTVSSKLN